MAVDDSAQVPGSDNRVFHGREATVRIFIEEITGADNSIDVNGEFTRVSGGTRIGSRPNRAILFRLEKDGDIINYLMNNAIFQQMGEISLAGDDAAEITGTALCRVADRDVEDNFS